MVRVHYVHPDLINPVHPIHIKVVGCGGNGSAVLKNLAKIHTTLLALGHMGLFVTAYDPDDVNDPNIGRQLFFPSDVGRNKAVVLIERINRSFGTTWEPSPGLFMEGSIKGKCSILISCVDKGPTRLDIASWIKINLPDITRKGQQPYDKFYYWIDMGNTLNSGQVIVGSVKITQPESKYETVDKLPSIADLYAKDLKAKPSQQDGPSCSTAESISRQDLFINSQLADHACKILWNMLRKGIMQHHGIFYNGDTETTVPLEL